MKELKDYTDSELRDEVIRRKEKEEFAKWNRVPEGVNAFSEVKDLIDDHKHETYIVHVDDGCEGFEFIVQTKRDHYDDGGMAMKMATKFAVETYDIDPDADYNDIQIYDISLEEFGRYGFKIIRED